MTLFFFVYIFREKINNLISGLPIMKKVDSSTNFRKNTKSAKLIDAYVIIGEPNMGKSSVARHLYGATKGPYNKRVNIRIQPIRLTNGLIIDVGLQGYQSLQEAGITPQSFARYLSNLKQRPDAVLFTLQLNPRAKLFAGATTYFQALNGVVNVVATAVLDTNVKAAHAFPNCRTFQTNPNGIPVAGNPVITTNDIAKDIRQFFQWV